jgi:hypothetical protein
MTLDVPASGLRCGPLPSAPRTVPQPRSAPAEHPLSGLRASERHAFRMLKSPVASPLSRRWPPSDRSRRTVTLYAPDACPGLLNKGLQGRLRRPAIHVYVLDRDNGTPRMLKSVPHTAGRGATGLLSWCALSGPPRRWSQRRPIRIVARAWHSIAAPRAAQGLSAVEAPKSGQRSFIINLELRRQVLGAKPDGYEFALRREDRRQLNQLGRKHTLWVALVRFVSREPRFETRCTPTVGLGRG